MMDWKTDAPLGPWTSTWDIPNPFDSEEDAFLRTIIATWACAPALTSTFLPLSEYKDKVLGRVCIWNC